MDFQAEPPPLNEGREVNPDDTGNRHGSRPQPRAPLNEGREVNPDDTTSTAWPSASSPCALNEGREVNPDDTSDAVAGKWLSVNAQRRSGG